MTFCTQCADEFSPVEYVTVPQDPDEPRFCSPGCEEQYGLEREAYDSYGGAVVWP